MENNQMENIISDLQTRPIEKETLELLKEIKKELHNIRCIMEFNKEYVAILKADYLKKVNQTMCGTFDFDDISYRAMRYLNHQ